MNKYLSLIINSILYPSYCIIKISTYVFLGGIEYIISLVSELFGKHRLHSSHCLQNVSNSISFQFIKVFCSMNVPNI